jgi:hypothetical protein
MIKKVVMEGQSDVITKDEVAKRIDGYPAISVFGYKKFNVLRDSEEIYVLLRPPNQSGYIWMAFAYNQASFCSHNHNSYNDARSALDEMDAIYVAESLNDVIEVINIIKRDHIDANRRG